MSLGSWGMGKRKHSLGNGGLLMLGKGVPPTLARLEGVPLPRRQKCGANGLLETTSDARECSVRAPGGDVQMPWRARGWPGVIGAARA